MTTAHLTIDLDAIASNWRALDKMSAASVQTAAVMKADAYGLGLAPVARALAYAGARRFFVAYCEEGAELRRVLGPGPHISVLSGHMPGNADMIRANSLTPMLASVEQVVHHLETLPGHPFGVQLDTGMNRLGVEPEDWAAIAPLVLEARPELLTSHLACSDNPAHEMNAAQLETFLEMTSGMGIPRSFAATGGILLGPAYHFELTRPGIGLYGGMAFDGMRPTVRLSLPIIQLRNVAQGEVVGYSGTWIAPETRRIATLSGGYADGLSRILSNRAMLWHRDTPCPLVGRVSMDMITVDVSHLNDVPESLDIIGPYQSVEDLAAQAGTISYEVLTALGARHRRDYRGQGAL